MELSFGTNGVRALWDELNPTSAVKLGLAIANYLGERKRVAVGRDHRLTSPAIQAALMSGLAAGGCEVFDLGMLSTPACAAWGEHHADAVAIITASHNPPEWNAVKVIVQGIPVSKEQGEEIVKKMNSLSLAEWREVGGIKRVENALEWHMARIRQFLNFNPKDGEDVKVLGDCGHGMASLYVPFFAELCDFASVNADISPFFPSRPSEPREEYLGLLKELMRSGDYDLGLAWDGDADRLVLVDKEGQFLPGDVVFALSILLLAEEQDVRKVVSTVSTSRIVEDAAQRVGAKVIYGKVGSPYLVQGLKAEGADIAGEEVGGVIWPRFSLEKDGIYTAARLIKALREGKFYPYLRSLPKYVVVKEKVPADENRWEVVREVARRLKEDFGDAVIDVDGVRVNLKEGWFLIRASGTEPYIRVFAEAKTEGQAKKWIEEGKALLREVAK